MKSSVMGLAGKILKGRFKDAKKAVVEALEKGKKKGEEVMDDLDLHPEDMGDFLKELWTDFAGIMDDATKGVIAAGLKKASMEQKIRFIEPLSAEDRQQLSQLSPEMKAIVFHCSRVLQEREKMIFLKIRTVGSLNRLSQKLGLAIDLSSYPVDASVVGMEKGKGEDLVVDFCLEPGNYSRKMVRLASISAVQLYK